MKKLMTAICLAGLAVRAETVLYFDGNTYIDIGKNYALADSVSLSAWVRVSPNIFEMNPKNNSGTVYYGAGIAGQGYWGGAQGFGMFVNGGANTPNDSTDDGVSCQVRKSGSVSEANNNLATCTYKQETLFTANEWHHYLVVRDKDAGKVRFYVDGSLVQEKDFLASISIAPTKNFAIGKNMAGSGGCFVGYIAEVAIWNAALSAADAASLPGNGPLNCSVRPYAYFPLDEGTGQGVYGLETSTGSYPKYTKSAGSLTWEEDSSCPFSRGDRAEVYVKADATGANDGTSWTDAYTDIAAGVSDASVRWADLYLGSGDYSLLGTLTPSVGPGATFNILDGAELFATNSARNFALSADNSRIFMDGGYLRAYINDKYGLFSGTPQNCRWDLVNGSTVYMTGGNGYPYLSGSNNVISVVNSTNNFDNGNAGHIGRSMKFYKAEDCVWAFTNSYVTSFIIGFGNSNDDSSTYNLANYNGYARRNRLIFHNSRATLYNTDRGLYFGARNLTNQSFSNRVEVTGSSGNLVLRLINMRGFSDVFRMEGGTVSASAGLRMTGEFNRFENAGGTVTIVNNGITISNHDNVLKNCGGTLSNSKTTTVGGVSNRIELTSGTISGAVTLNGGTNLYVQTGGTASGATTVGGTTNRLEMSGGTRTGAVTVSGRNDVFRLSGGLLKAALTMSGASNVYEQVSGVSTGNVTVAGFGNTLYFRGGTHWGQYRQALVFNANTTNNMVVIDDAEFIHHGTFGKSYSDGVGWPYVNTPNCAIEFRGSAPKFRVTSPNQANNSTPWHTVNLGKGTEPLQDPVRLRFILPQTPYAEAPFRSEVSGHNAVLDGNAVIEVDDSNLPRSHGKLRYPLVYDKGTFSSGSRINVESLNRVNRELGTIGEDMKFVRSGGTLYVEIASKAATKIYVR